MTKYIVAAVIGLALVAGGWWSWQRATHEHAHVPVIDDQGSVYYSCPMHPEVRRDAPGSCPICGMPLVERRESATPSIPAPAHDDSLVVIDPRLAQSLGMRTAPIRRGTLRRQMVTVGSVAVDERRIVTLEARAAGWVEELAVRAAGDPVVAGQVVAGVYAPEILAAQEELALARKLDDVTLLEAARSRLSLLGVNPDTPLQRRVPLLAPLSGIVTELGVREGARIEPGMPLMTIADLSAVWVMVDIPEAQSAWIAAGTPARARLRALPGETFDGAVDYVYPLLDTATRVVRARLAFANPAGRLRPGMYAEVTLTGSPETDVHLVPAEAVIRTGTRAVVIVAESEGRFRPVEVVLGREQDEEIVLREGPEPGTEVVVSGQFLIDSEASLQGAYRRMQAPAAHPGDHR